MGDKLKLLHAPTKAGRLSSPFGPRTSPITGKPSFHNGVDISCPVGTPVYAVLPGFVYAVQYRDEDKSGRYVCVRTMYTHRMDKLEDPDTVAYSYAHLSACAVEPGDKIKAGQLLGYAGNTGSSTGPHVHFRMFQYHKKRSFDPAPLLEDHYDDSADS